MKRNKILIIGLAIVIAVTGTIYFSLNYYEMGKSGTNVSETTNPVEALETVEDGSIVKPLPTTTPMVTPKEEEQVQLSKSRYVVTQLIDGKKKYGYITEKGEMIIEPRYSYASDFKKGVGIVSKDEKFNLIDIDGNILFSNDTAIGEFINGAARFSKMIGEDILYGYINNTGEVIIEPRYMYAYDFNVEQQAYIKLSDGKYALINIKGEIITTYDFNSKYSSIYQIADDYVIYYDSISGKYGVDNLVSGEAINEPIFSAIEYLGQNLFAMKEPNLEYYEISDLSPSALFNNKGEQITEYKLYDITHFNGDYASVTDSTSTYFIGLDGKEITTLPKFLGRGTLIMLGDMVKAEIDGDLFYNTMDGDVVYQTNNIYDLGSGIIVKEEKFKANKFVLVRYPHIEGFKNVKVEEEVNRQLETLFTQYRKDLKEEDALTVNDSFIPSIKKNLIVISMTGYDFSFGAAHGMPLKEYYYIDINTGRFFHLGDLLKAENDYQTKINEIINREIEKRMEEDEDYFFSDAFTGIEADHNFILTDNSIIIYFYPYDIASFSQGFPQFEIPFKDIMDLIDIEGEFYKAFN